MAFRLRTSTFLATSGGIVAGLVLISLGVIPSLTAEPAGRLSASHSGSTLVIERETVDLTVLVACPWSSANEFEENLASITENCDLDVTLWFRKGRLGGFEPKPTEVTDDFGIRTVTLEASEGLDGSAYWFEVIDRVSGQSITLPPQGANQPYRMWVLDPRLATHLELPEHQYGAVRPPDQTLAHLTWGSQGLSVGLDSPPPGMEGEVSGPQAFDVTEDGSVHILDTVNRRIISVTPGTGTAVWATGLPMAGIDLALVGNEAAVLAAPGGHSSIHIINPTADTHDVIQLLRGDRASSVRGTPWGLAVHSLMTDMWVEAATMDGSGLLKPVNLASAATRPDHLIDAEVSLATRVLADELRIAILRNDQVVSWWSFTDPDGRMGPLLDISFQGGVLTFVSFEADATHDEFRVVKVEPTGTITTLALDASSAVRVRTNRPVRVVGDTVYQLAPSSTGVHVRTFDLGETQ